MTKESVVLRLYEADKSLGRCGTNISRPSKDSRIDYYITLLGAEDRARLISATARVLSNYHIYSEYATAVFWDPGLEDFVHIGRGSPSNYLSNFGIYCKAALLSDLAACIDAKYDIDYPGDRPLVYGDEIEVNKLPRAFIRKNLIKALSTTYPERFFIACKEANILQHVCRPLYNCIGVTQNPDYHPETVFIHLMRTLKASVDRTTDPLLRLACVLHDVGKPPTRKEVPVEETNDK